jgi:hypothetical protein
MGRAPAFAALLIGLWLGGSITLVAVVGYGFSGMIDRALAANPGLAARAGFDPKDEGAKKTSVLWVYTGEQNRAYFRGWNAVQIVLGTAATLAALVARSRKAAVVLLLAALGIACALAFYLAPEITARGRALDFVPRTPPPGSLAVFNVLHRLYTGLEAAKILLLAAAAWLALRRPAAPGAGPPG